MPRFFYSDILAVGAQLTLPDALAHHVQVLRLAAGSPITLFNGAGGEYTATLTALEKRRVSAEVREYAPREVELPYAVTLAQALPEASKMDWIIEKAVELGAAAIVPLAAQRCVVRLSAERAEKRRVHWQGIIVAASEQCGRNRLASLGQLQDYQQWISQPSDGQAADEQAMHAQGGGAQVVGAQGVAAQAAGARHGRRQRIILTPRAEQSLAGWARSQPAQAVTLVIGPEGGLSDAEERAAVSHGALALSMGPRILRTETAGLSAIATLNAMWGGM